MTVSGELWLNNSIFNQNCMPTAMVNSSSTSEVCTANSGTSGTIPNASLRIDASC